MNSIYLDGNLTREVDYREFPGSEGAVCTLRIAHNEKYSVRGGETKEKVLYINVKARGRLAVTCRQFLSKGSQIMVSGRMELWQWQTKDGQPRQEIGIAASEIKFIDRGPRRETAQGQSGPVDEAYNPRTPISSRHENGHPTADDADVPPPASDDIPF